MDTGQYLFWFLNTARLPDIFFVMFRAFVVCLVYYQIDYGFLLLRLFWRKMTGKTVFTGLPPDQRFDALVVIPTLLRSDDELSVISRALVSLAQNGYPGRLYVVCAIDGGDTAPEYYRKLESWINSARMPAGVHMAITSTKGRQGKAMAIEHGIRFTEQWTAQERLPFPQIFFNMDADGELDPRTLERMVYKLAQRSRITGRPGMMVAPNVKVRTDHYWNGWLHALSIRGMIKLAIAAEYMTSISAAKHNSKILPTIVASGALYCTWSEIPRQSAKYAHFMMKLRYRDVLKWWFGFGAPRFSDCTLDPLPEALTGEGDDAWMTWLASCAVWRQGRISLEFPRTPIHALGRLFISYFWRAVRFDPEARVYTRSPYKVKSLFKQRLRWNGSRSWGIQRWHKAFFYHWVVAFPVLLNTVFVTGTVILTAVFVVASVLGGSAKDILPALILVNLAYILIRLFSMLVAFLHEPRSWQQWHKLLIMPLMPTYQIIFNVSTTFLATLYDTLGTGLKTGFAPEHVFINGRTSRVALGYRLRRFLSLCARRARGERIPFGRFWFGWYETAWTTNGYQGWDRKPSAHGVKAQAASVSARQRTQTP